MKQKETGTQREKFIQTARALGCDESEEAFDAKLKKLMTHKPMTQAQVKKKSQRSRKK